MPLSLRSYIRKHFYYAAGESLRLRGNEFELPYYLTDRYLDKIFGSSELSISEYVQIDRISDPLFLSRVLTAELVITDRF